MSTFKAQGNASGTGEVTLQTPNTNTNRTISLPDATTTLVGTDTTDTLTNKTLTSPTITGAVMSSMASSVLTSGTSQATTSGTSIDFTSIPSWVKRITVMFNLVSTNGSSELLIQIGDGAIVTSNYSSTGLSTSAGGSIAKYSTSGFVLSGNNVSTNFHNGNIVICRQTANNWVASGVLTQQSTQTAVMGGIGSLTNALDRLRITTVNGTDAFDAGSINILYE